MCHEVTAGALSPQTVIEMVWGSLGCKFFKKKKNYSRWYECIVKFRNFGNIYLTIK